MASLKRSTRGVRHNKRYCQNAEEEDSKLPKRRCDRQSCPNEVPICFARVSDKCAGSKWTSKWCHISPAEHFCNECFEYFYRSHKHGYQLFEEWKNEWSTYGNSEASLKKFMSDCLVPYWVQCTIPECRKWRQLSKDLDLKPAFIDKYVCGMAASGTKKGNQKDACSIPEDERVAYTKDDIWIRETAVPPYLKNSPAAPMLMGYYPDGVGSSATDPVMQTKASKPTVFPCCEFLRPFVHSETRELAFMFRPDMMSVQEITAFPLLAEEQPFMYLAVRNLIMAIWSLNIKEWVTKEACSRQLICRGLNRACCVQLLDIILTYLTSKGFINVGLVRPPPHIDFFSPVKCEVLLIGSGISGLAAARRLADFGIKVKILESKDHIGGRVSDDYQKGVCFARGAQLLTGAVNSPVALMAYQIDQPLHRINDHCQILLNNGKVVDPVTVRRLDFHFNALLDVIGQRQMSNKPDVSFLDKFTELHREFVEETQLAFTEEEQQILQFHLSSVEHVSGCSLHKLSAQYWDQNEALPQFGEPHLLLPAGCSPLLSHLAQGLDVVFNSRVTEVDYRGDKVVLTAESGESYTADRVIITVPLAVLKSGILRFKPALPNKKKNAIAGLGVGKIEKVILQFEEKFWCKKTKDDFFGCVPPNQSKRGLFNLFFSVTFGKSQTRDRPTYLLVTYVVGDALDLVRNKTDEEIKDMCLGRLDEIFPGKVPVPVYWIVTSWHLDKDIQMSHTYLPVGVDGQFLDDMAENIADKVYFAGEATSRQFPHSVAGAYLSGIREASKIIDDLQGLTDGSYSSDLS